MKKRIRLTESQLYELVEQALNEADWKTYMNAAKKAYDLAEKFYDDCEQNGWDEEKRKEYRKMAKRWCKFRDAAKSKYVGKYWATEKHAMGCSPEGFPTYSGWGAYDYIQNAENAPGNPDYLYITTAELDDPTDISASFDTAEGDYDVSHIHYSHDYDDDDDDYYDDDDCYYDDYDDEESQKYTHQEPKPWNKKYPKSGYSSDDEEYSYAPRAFNDVNNYIKGKSQYIKGKGWNESLARKVTESVIRKLRRLI